MLMVVNHGSWMKRLRHLIKIEIDHLDTPALRHMNRREYCGLMAPFADIQSTTERFPVPIRVHRGVKAALNNRLFVPAFGPGSLRNAPTALPSTASRSSLPGGSKSATSACGTETIGNGGMAA